MKKLLQFLILITSFNLSAQDFLGLQSSNYAGVIGAYSNPANIVDNRLKFDLVLVGNAFAFDNNYVGVKRSALKYTGKLMDGSAKLPGSWDSTRKGSPDYWKNNFVVSENSKNKSVYFANRVVLPSFMFQINKKNALSFNWGVRSYLNVDGISPNLAKLI